MNKTHVLLGLLVLSGVIVWFTTQPQSPVVEDEQDNDVVYSHPDIVVDDPAPYANITSPVTATGQARGTWFFEADFPVRVVDGNGQELGVGIAVAQDDWMTEDFVPFVVDVSFDPPETATGEIIFVRDNPTGLPEHDDQFAFPVSFATDPGEAASQTQTISLYFYDAARDVDDDGVVQCSPDAVVQSSRTIPATTTPARAVVELVLAGEITDAEAAAGLSTEYPLPGVGLEDIQLRDGVLTITLADPELATSGGSCRVTILRTQLEKTALQFATVDEVVILPEDVFQP